MQGLGGGPFEVQSIADLVQNGELNQEPRADLILRSLLLPFDVIKSRKSLGISIFTFFAFS